MVKFNSCTEPYVMSRRRMVSSGHGRLNQRLLRQKLIKSGLKAKAWTLGLLREDPQRYGLCVINRDRQ